MAHQIGSSTKGPAIRDSSAIDPVCGMHVDPHTALAYQFAGKHYYFCNPSCRTKFQKSPEQILADRAAKDAAAELPHIKMTGAQLPTLTLPTLSQTPLPSDVSELAHVQSPEQSAESCEADIKSTAVYICPMHLEIEQVGPGTCPICGMDLEPKFASADSVEEDTALAEMTRRFWIAAGFSIPLFGLAMGPMIGIRFGSFEHSGWYGGLQLLLATPVVFWCGWPLLIRGVQSIRSGNLNMFTLIAVGTLTAFTFSTLTLVFPGFVPTLFREEGHLPLYFEAAAVITTLVLLGQVLELRARSKTGGALRSLMELSPKTATVLAGNAEHEVALEHILIGDRIRIRPGDKIPVDGSVVDGKSTINESMLTGEAMPITKTVGDDVIGGTLNQSGVLIIQANKVGSETVLSQIVQLVASAQRSQAPIQKTADLVAKFFVPTVVGIACLTFLAWMFLGPAPRIANALVASISVLIIACPCALGLATPMSIMVGIGRGASEGILIKNAEVLQQLEKVDTIVFDKTGTITAGAPKLVDVVLLTDQFSKEQIQRWGATLEKSSEHPLARAISEGISRDSMHDVQLENFESIAGGGVAGQVAGHSLLIGNAVLLNSRGVTGVDVAEQRAISMRNGGATIVLMAIDGGVAALFAIEDPIKATSHDAIRHLRSTGMKLLMLTGDAHATASAVAKKVGIEDFEANVSPAQKHELLEKLKRGGNIIAMVGDGVNDAPALAVADVGIAMGTGSGVAIEAASVTLISGDLDGVAKAITLSRSTMSNIRQNLFLAFFYNAASVPIAAGVLYPVLGWLLSPMLAAAAMSLSSVSVITNALRLRRADL